MARIRSIKPEFWTSEQVTECSLNARLLFIGLWNFADDLGRLPMSAKSVKAKIFPSDDMQSETILGMLAELSENGLILTYEVDGKEYLQITGWQHQRIDKPQPGKYPAPVAGYSTNATGALATDTIGKEEKGKDRKGERETRARDLPSASGMSVVPDAISVGMMITAREAGMTETVAHTEWKIFKARKLSDGKLSADWEAEWSIWCERWKAKQPVKQTDAPTTDRAALDWEKQLSRFKKGHPWTTQHWGPEPGQLGCWVPTELLAKHGFEIPTSH